ncbi:MAG TPA: NUDIX domain-containing protein [Microbacteriaceae bacterium]|nr:NUDIX domain-containing protein [Microbacteriaceae bacterium]
MKQVFAAGAVCWRPREGKTPAILVVHRAKYGDVSLPKGKVEPGEALPQTAVREIREETGLAVVLGVPLGTTSYTIGGGRTKNVQYWAAEVAEEALARSTFVPNHEIAALEWVGLKKARKYLSYERDVAIVDTFAALVERGVTSTFALIGLRHGQAVPATEWDGPDATRPLTDHGARQASANVGPIGAWRPRKLLTSTAVRCVGTVAPLAASFGVRAVREEGLSQDAHEAGEGTVRQIVGKRVRKRRTAVLCSHGPVLPVILREIALAAGGEAPSELRDAARLTTGGFSVVHLSVSNPGAGILAIETHPEHR